jgi:predicted phage-related endonuclease
LHFLFAKPESFRVWQASSLVHGLGGFDALRLCGQAHWTMKIDLVRDKTGPVHQPEKRNGKQGADDHEQSDKKPDLLLMRG